MKIRWIAAVPVRALEGASLQIRTKAKLLAFSAATVPWIHGTVAAVGFEPTTHGL